MLVICPTCGSEVASVDLPDEVEVADVMDRTGIRGRLQGVMFLMLWRANGRTVCHESIMDITERVTQIPRHQEGVRSIKKKLAREVLDLPIEIAPVRGLGYRMICHQLGWDWRNLPVRHQRST